MSKITISHEIDFFGGVMIRANVAGKSIGMLWLTGEFAHIDNGRFVRLIKVDSEFQRQGIATAMWNYAVEHGFKPQHELEKTDAGKAWAAKVGA